MAFCTKCGKEIPDGQVCSCQTVKPAMNVNVAGEATNLVGDVIGIVNEPESGVARFIANITWAKTVILAGIWAILQVIYQIWYKVAYNIDRKKSLEDAADDLDMDLDEYMDLLDMDHYGHSFGDILKGCIMSVIETACIIAVAAVIFYFAIKLIKKVTISWQAAFGMAVADLLVAIPLYLAYRILHFIPDFKLWGWILSMVWAVKTWGSYIIQWLAVKSVCDDTKSTAYVMVPAIAAISFASAFVSFLLNSLFF